MRRTGFARLVREARQRAGLTQTELAAALTAATGVSFTQATISGFEQGRQVPEGARLKKVVAGMSAELGIEEEVLEAAASAASGSAVPSPFVLSEDLGPQIRKALDDRTKRIWATNPSALAFATDDDILKIWIDGICMGLSYGVIWPLDLTFGGGFLRARDGFCELRDRLKARLNKGEDRAQWGKVTHYAVSRRPGVVGVDPAEEYLAIGRALKFDPVFDFRPPLRIYTSEDTGVRAAAVHDKPPFLANFAPDLVIPLDAAYEALAAFTQWNAASVLYDGPAGPKLSIFHREVKSPEGMALQKNEGGLWRGELEAFEMKRAVEDFTVAADALLDAASKLPSGTKKEQRNAA